MFILNIYIYCNIILNQTISNLIITIKMYADIFYDMKHVRKITTQWQHFIWEFV